MGTNNTNNFYDLEQIKSIPILDVCNAFGIVVERKGGNLWCKVRPERTASAILHPENNTFHDFGTNMTSDVIGLVSLFHGVDRGAAIQQLAGAFSISTSNPRGGLADTELTSWEYKMIGLDGGMATKNFDFDLSRQDPSRVMELSLLYGMPMNVLKRQHTRIFEKLIRQRALPHVRDLRRDYYMEVFTHYNLARNIGSVDVFHKSVENGEFNERIKELKQAENLLIRACSGTWIKARPVGEYDPATDIEKILSGEIKISTLGNATFDEVKKRAEEQSTSVSYYTVDYDGFMNLNGKLKPFTHNAFLKDGNVVVQYLRKDWKDLKDIFSGIRIQRKENLNDKIAGAKERSGNQEGPSYQKNINPSKANTGEER